MPVVQSYLGGIAQLGWLSKINKGLLILSVTAWLSLLSKESVSDRGEIRHPRRRSTGTRIYYWGYSSVGRANGSQSLGQEFDPPYLHQLKKAALKPLFYFTMLLLLSTTEIKHRGCQNASKYRSQNCQRLSAS